MKPKELTILMIQIVHLMEEKPFLQLVYTPRLSGNGPFSFRQAKARFCDVSEGEKDWYHLRSIRLSTYRGMYKRGLFTEITNKKHGSTRWFTLKTSEAAQ